MRKAIFSIPQMDCPAEETLIRLKLQDLTGVERLDFNLQKRELTVYYHNQLDGLIENLNALQLGSKLVEDDKSEPIQETASNNQRKLLWMVLIINFLFFLIEGAYGYWSHSLGLLADGLDMLADASVYGLSLLVVGGSLGHKKQVAKWAGSLQLGLAGLGFFEVIRRFVTDQPLPLPATMVAISVFALVANAACLWLLSKSTGKNETHIKASMIFTSNDVVLNIGVMLAAGLVQFFQSNWPDLIIGAAVFVLVLRGSLRIFQLGTNN